jgi:hypothetical protein
MTKTPPSPHNNFRNSPLGEIGAWAGSGASLPGPAGVAPVGATRAGEQRFSPNGAKKFGSLSGRRLGRTMRR